MKKFAMSLIVSLAISQSVCAATSALTESLLEFEAITTAIGSNPAFQDIIPPTEFIVEIERITHAIDVLGKVKYEIETRSVIDSESDDDRHHAHHKYRAVLEVAPNPGIGPNIITVVKIKKEH